MQGRKMRNEMRFILIVILVITILFLASCQKYNAPKVDEQKKVLEPIKADNYSTDIDISSKESDDEIVSDWEKDLQELESLPLE